MEESPLKSVAGRSHLHKEHKKRINVLSSLKLESFVSHCNRCNQNDRRYNDRNMKTKNCQTDHIIKKEVKLQCDDDNFTKFDKVLMACKNKDYKQLCNIKHNGSKTGPMKPFMNSPNFPTFIEEATSILEAELQIPNVVFPIQHHINTKQVSITNKRCITKNDDSWKKKLENKKIIQLIGPIILEVNDVSK